MLVQKFECEVSKLSKILNNKENCLLIDVREYPEYAAGRIAQARLIPLGELEKRANELDKQIPIYLICRSGRRASQAQDKLLALGFSDVHNVRGGMMAWQAAGLPIEVSQKAPWALERQVRLVAGSLVLLGTLLSLFVYSAFIYLAMFVGAGLVFAAITDSCAMAMLLAKLPWNKADTQNCSVQRG
ncbi:MAG: rhodanese-like domain-containing protein [Blastocatellia bacterium]